MNNVVKLGQRVYGVTSKGEILPTLISKLELSEVNANTSEFNQCFTEGLRGTLHGKFSPVQYRVLNHALGHTWLTFDKAYGHALVILQRLKESDTITVREQKEYNDRHKMLLSSKKSVKEAVASITQFSESNNLIGTLPGRDKEKHQHSQKDFPQHYIEPGTPVWIASTKKWHIIQGFVTEVHFTPTWHRNFVYYCGSHSNLRSDRVFRTKRGAMNCLEREFAKKLPGVLDRRSVQVVQQLSKLDKQNRMFDALTSKSESVAIQKTLSSDI